MSEEQRWYLADGREVELIEQCQHGCIVREIYDGEGGEFCDEPRYSKPRLVDTVYRSSAVPKLLPVQWAESIIEQCRKAGVACFCKQLGANPRWAGAKSSPIENARGKNDDMSRWPEALRVQQFPEVSNAAL
jgi:hypothetical protein